MCLHVDPHCPSIISAGVLLGPSVGALPGRQGGGSSRRCCSYCRIGGSIGGGQRRQRRRRRLCCVGCADPHGRRSCVQDHLPDRGAARVGAVSQEAFAGIKGGSGPFMQHDCTSVHGWPGCLQPLVFVDPPALPLLPCRCRLGDGASLLIATGTAVSEWAGRRATTLLPTRTLCATCHPAPQHCLATAWAPALPCTGEVPDAPLAHVLHDA